MLGFHAVISAPALKFHAAGCIAGGAGSGIEVAGVCGVEEILDVGTLFFSQSWA